VGWTLPRLERIGGYLWGNLGAALTAVFFFPVGEERSRSELGFVVKIVTSQSWIKEFILIKHFM
jgi:hypothetical protein